MGDNGNLLGEITAVTLDAVTNQGNRVMFDDLEVDSVTPPTRSNLSLTMTNSAATVTVGDTIRYDLTAWQGVDFGTNSIADAPGFVSGTDLRGGE